MSVEAVRTLNAAYQAVHDANPDDTTGARAWAAVLLKPQLGRIENACDVLEQAAIGIAPRPVASDLDGNLLSMPKCGRLRCTCHCVYCGDAGECLNLALST